MDTFFKSVKFTINVSGRLDSISLCEFNNIKRAINQIGISTRSLNITFVQYLQEQNSTSAIYQFELSEKNFNLFDECVLKAFQNQRVLYDFTVRNVNEDESFSNISKSFLRQGRLRFNYATMEKQNVWLSYHLCSVDSRTYLDRYHTTNTIVLAIGFSIAIGVF